MDEQDSPPPPLVAAPPRPDKTRSQTYNRDIRETRWRRLGVVIKEAGERIGASGPGDDGE